MKNLTRFGLAALLLAAPLVLTSCKDDDDDVEVKILSAVAGDYKGNETCAPSPASADYLVHVYNTSQDNNKVHIDNIYGLTDYIGQHILFTANVNGTSITLPDTDKQIIDGTDTLNIRVGANGTLNGDIMTLNFRIYGDLGDDTCTFVGNRAYLNAPVGNGL